MSKIEAHSLAEHFFRKEYGKMVSIIAKYLGAENIETAEDIVQETLLKAVNLWQHNGIPNNPEAWLYKTAKNHALNIVKRNKRHSELNANVIIDENIFEDYDEVVSSEDHILDEQLKMMFVCCDERISEDSQVILILKILCGFSIKEIASAFFSNYETINKRLSRGRKEFRNGNFNHTNSAIDNSKIPVILKTIYLLFNEGYKSSSDKMVLRTDLCFEAIRLTHLLVKSSAIADKSDCYALLALMYLNVSRFESRITDQSIVEMKNQDRSKWNQELINHGVSFLKKAAAAERVSVYLIMATISANHCISPSYDETNWNEILVQYDNLIKINDSPIIQLNRCVALSKVEGNLSAIEAMKLLSTNPKIETNHLYHATIAEFYSMEYQIENAKNHFDIAIDLCGNTFDIELLNRKISNLVPV